MREQAWTQASRLFVGATCAISRQLLREPSGTPERSDYSRTRCGTFSCQIQATASARWAWPIGSGGNKLNQMSRQAALICITAQH
jgi:hypothetical protein